MTGGGLRVHHLALSMLLTSASPALAADCANPYTVDALLGDLVSVEGALRSGDDETAGTTARKLRDGLVCLEELLPRIIAGRAYRAIGAGLVASGAEDEGRSWFRTAAEIEQAFEYGLEDLPAEHPVRDAYAAAKQNSSGEEVLVEGQEFVDGEAHLDGRSLETPKARLGRPHLFQWEAGSVQSFVIEGNAFPSDLLTGAAVAAADDPPDDDKKDKKDKKDKPPKDKKDKPPKDKKDKAGGNTSGGGGTLVIERQRPWEKTPLMIGGVAVMGGAGALYYVSLAKRGQFNSSNDLDEINELRPQINRLVIASAAVFAVGAGTLTWGVILDGSGAPLPAVRVRF